eukprot:2399623-Amphidinium_carterae.1
MSPWRWTSHAITYGTVTTSLKSTINLKPSKVRQTYKLLHSTKEPWNRNFLLASETKHWQIVEPQKKGWKIARNLY